jgi:hypothetical protein
MRGSLHCAMDDEAVHGSGRDDEVIDGHSCSDNDHGNGNGDDNGDDNENGNGNNGFAFGAGDGGREAGFSPLRCSQRREQLRSK